MNTTKKTVVAKLSFDVSGKSDILIEMYKSLLRQSFIECGMDSEDISFEVLVKNDEDALASMRKAVQSEFQVADAEQATTDNEVAEAEKSDWYAGILSLFKSFVDEDEDEDEAEGGGE